MPFILVSVGGSAWRCFVITVAWLCLLNAAHLCCAGSIAVVVVARAIIAHARQSLWPVAVGLDRGALC